MRNPGHCKTQGKYESEIKSMAAKAPCYFFCFITTNCRKMKGILNLTFLPNVQNFPPLMYTTENYL